MATYTFGLAKVMVADVSADGTMPETSTMTKIGEVFWFIRTRRRGDY